MSGDRVAEAVDHYHELLSGEHRETSLEYFSRTFSTPRLLVAGRPICNVLRPFFLTRNTYESVLRASSLVMRAVAVLEKALMEDAALRGEMDLSPEEEELIQIDCGYGAQDVSARLDGFLTSDGDFHFVEYNADSPGGIAFGEALGGIFAEHPLMSVFARRFRWQFAAARGNVMDALLGAYRRWGGTGSPHIAIVDWRTSGTYNEFLLMQEFFESNGLRVRVADPGELEFRNGKVFIEDFQVDLIYKRLLVGDIIARLGLLHPLVQAVRNRTVCLANGFRVQMLFKKMLFALLSDPAYESLFQAEIREALNTHIPWTRRVREGTTTYQNRTIDLIPFIEKNRDKLVLKPNAEYGGRGVVLGWECEETHWAEALQNAVDTSYVVQERVPVGKELFPHVVEGALRFNERYFDLDPYVWDGCRVDGCGVRLSSAAILNVAGGGSATPLFILD